MGMNQMNRPLVVPWVRESNLIEGIDDHAQDVRSSSVWYELTADPAPLFTKEVTEGSIRWIHLHLLAELSPRICGKFRTVDVTVGGRLCPQHLFVPGLVEQWVRKWGKPFENDALHMSRVHMRDQAIQSHVEFEKIHPFEDGNGRTGRMLMNWQLHRIGQEAMPISHEDREAYYEWFR